jgi:two-component system, OmpR family, response regulator ResD
VKPFSPREVVARVRAVLRRHRSTGAGPGGPSVVVSGALSVDLGARTATRDGRAISLRAREFELLAFLMRNRGRAFTREELLEHVWGYAYGDTATVTVHVRRLRDKIELDPAHPSQIVTVWGVGYRFDG